MSRVTRQSNLGKRSQDYAALAGKNHNVPNKKPRSRSRSTGATWLLCQTNSEPVAKIPKNINENRNVNEEVTLRGGKNHKSRKKEKIPKANVATSSKNYQEKSTAKNGKFGRARMESVKNCKQSAIETKISSVRRVKNTPVKTKNNNVFLAGVDENDQEQDQEVPGDGVDVSVGEDLDYEFPESYGDSEDNQGNVSSDGSMQGDIEEVEGDVRKISSKAPKESMENYESDEELVMKNPSLRKLFNKLLDERIKQATQHGELSTSNLLTTLGQEGRSKGNIAAKQNNQPLVDNIAVTPQKRVLGDRIIKSSSDTTIYAPALAQKSCNVNAESRVDLIGRGLNFTNHPVTPPSAGKQGNKDQEKLIETISNFVENIRMDQEEKMIQENRRSEINVPGQDEARRKSDHAVLEAEKFKASIAAPPGENNDVIQLLQMLKNMPNKGDNLVLSPGINGAAPATIPITLPVIGEGISNDDFFHLICHVDAGLKAKIKNGDFVDLDKLLPKDKNNPQAYLSEFEKLEWVHSEYHFFGSS